MQNLFFLYICLTIYIIKNKLSNNNKKLRKHE